MHSYLLADLHSMVKKMCAIITLLLYTDDEHKGSRLDMFRPREEKRGRDR